MSMTSPPDQSSASSRHPVNALRTLPKAPHREVEFPFGRITLYPRHVEMRARGGVELGHPEFEAMIEVLLAHFEQRPYGYLSVREEDYSVDPMAGKRVVTETGVVAGAFVIRSESARRVLEVEKLFYQRPVRACATVEEGEAFLASHLGALPEAG
jgi:hypothetical protein